MSRRARRVLLTWRNGLSRYSGSWTPRQDRGFVLRLEGTKLTAQIIDNTAVIAGPGAFSSRQLYPQYAPFILNGFNEFSSSYNGGALRIDKRFSHGLTFLVSYTYSKTLDYVDNLSNGGVS